MSEGYSDDFGPLAPFIGVCGIRRVSREGGVGVSEVEVTPDKCNGAASAHGGLLMTLLDSVMASAARSTLADDHGMMTVDLQAQFLAPGRGKLTGRGSVARGGSTLIFCEGSITDAKGQVVAKGTGVFAPRKPRGAG